jgi:two-component system sensor histidine kinase CpxA
MQRTGSPARYWAGIHLDLAYGPDFMPLTLVMASESVTGGGLFIDLWPWIGLGAACLVVSALLWLPFVHGITRSISQLNRSAHAIAHGHFQARVPEKRSDELGELATSVNAMAGQLGDYVMQQRRITADVAHELCSPIARMQMALGIVEQRSTPDQSTYLKKLDGELQHMAKLVEEVLTFSKAESLPDRETPVEIHLHELIEQIITREAAGIGVVVDVPANLSLHTLYKALDRALGNVLRNAVRYAAHAGPIHIQASQENGQTIIKIADQGPGVPPETLPRLFEPFYRPEVARARHTGGSGLGLAIVKRCIEACKGSVTARLLEPSGLEVQMTIPSKK